jgi:hypothetical protein
LSDVSTVIGGWAAVFDEYRSERRKTDLTRSATGPPGDRDPVAADGLRLSATKGACEDIATAIRTASANAAARSMYLAAPNRSSPVLPREVCSALAG